jgi:DNA polymerase III delta prime subunit
MTNTTTLPSSINDTLLSIFDKRSQSNIVIVSSTSLHRQIIEKLVSLLSITNSSTLLLDVLSIFISNTDHLSIEAQNCLLKTLEEPNENCYFYLLTNNIDSLLKTVRSRCVVSAIKSIALSEALEHFKSSGQSDTTKAWSLCDGDYGSMKSLLEDTGSASAKCLSLAKEYLTAGALTKLKILYDLEHTDFIVFCGILSKIIRHQLMSAPTSVWKIRYKATLRAHELLLGNVNPKNIKLYLASCF